MLKGQCHKAFSVLGQFLGSISAALSCPVSPLPEKRRLYAWAASHVGDVIEKRNNLCVLGCHKSDFHAKKQYATKKQHEKAQKSLRKNFPSKVRKMDGVGVLANDSSNTPTKLVANSGCLICGSIQNDSRRRTSLKGRVTDLRQRMCKSLDIDIQPNGYICSDRCFRDIKRL